MYLDAADPHVATRRLEPQLVSRADRARPERAGHNRAEAGDRERTVDVQSSRPVRTHVLDGIGDPSERATKLVEALSGLRADADDLGAGNELCGLLGGELDSACVDCVDLGECDDASIDAEQPQDGEMLVGLRTSALPASTTSRKRSTPVAPATIVRTKRSCPGTSTTESRRPSASSSGA